jgi:uncharacterized protein (TIGR00369 family)
MSNDVHWWRLENMYHAAPCNAYYSPHLTVTEGKAVLVIDVKEKFFHAAMAVHGSVYFKALDDAAFFAVNSLVNDVFVLTTSFNIHLLKPVSKGVIKSVGEVVLASEKLFVAESRLYDSKDREIARGSGNFVKSNMTLTPQIGYK